MPLNPTKKITLYATKTCPYSKLTRDFLKENHVEFVEINVADDMIAANQMVKLSGQMGVPVLRVDETDINSVLSTEHVVGWNEGEIKGLLHIK